MTTKTVQTIRQVTPAFPFEAYSHIVSPIDTADGGGFMFTMPDIPGVMADGATELEAIADGREAFAATVSAMADMGREVPAPAFKPEDFTPASASGKVLARLPRSMHVQLTARAKTEGASLNALGSGSSIEAGITKLEQVLTDEHHRQTDEYEAHHHVE